MARPVPTTDPIDGPLLSVGIELERKKEFRRSPSVEGVAEVLTDTIM